MTTITKGWSLERRTKQAENCRITSPWTKSTGAKTKIGKEIAKNNAIKHGLRSVEGKKFFSLLKAQKEFVNNVKKLHSKKDIK